MSVYECRVCYDACRACFHRNSTIVCIAVALYCFLISDFNLRVYIMRVIHWFKFQTILATVPTQMRLLCCLSKPWISSLPRNLTVFPPQPVTMNACQTTLAATDFFCTLTKQNTSIEFRSEQATLVQETLSQVIILSYGSSEKRWRA